MNQVAGLWVGCGHKMMEGAPQNCELKSRGFQVCDSEKHLDLSGDTLYHTFHPPKQMKHVDVACFVLDKSCGASPAPDMQDLWKTTRTCCESQANCRAGCGLAVQRNLFHESTFSDKRHSTYQAPLYVLQYIESIRARRKTVLVRHSCRLPCTSSNYRRQQLAHQFGFEVAP